MRAILAEMDDSKNEKSLVQHYLIQKGPIPAFLLKFHPEAKAYRVSMGTAETIHQGALQVHNSIVT